ERADRLLPEAVAAHQRQVVFRRELKSGSAASRIGRSGANRKGKGAVMEKKKAPPVVSDINVTPMVDVMLVLLIIFMVITPMLTKGVTVTMVKTHNPIKMQESDKE